MMVCWVNVVPEKPTELDDVRVFVDFFSYTNPPHIVDFGKVHGEGNAFSVNATVHVPRRDEFVLQVIHNQSNTYTLGRLEAGEYAFRVYVQTVHGSCKYWLEREVKFTVYEPPHTPEMPSSGYLLVLLALTSAAVMLKFFKKETNFAGGRPLNG